MGTYHGGLNVIANSKLSVSSTAVGLSSADPALSSGKVNSRTVRRALFVVETATVRWRADGTDPTTSVGSPITAGGNLSCTDANYKDLINNIKFIRDSSDATVWITFFD